MYTSWSLKNPGRRFYTCCQSQDSRCDYFEWFDAETEGRQGDVVTQLNNRRIFLEEKISLLEEKVSMLEGRLAAKKKKAKALKATNAKYGWTYWTVIGLLMAMLLIEHPINPFLLLHKFMQS
ncbi:hypothetical protein ACET3Z_019608 [Daucus carota]